MPSRPLTRVLLTTVLALTLFAATALPSGAQVSPVAQDLVDQIGAIEGLDPLDPVLQPVTDLILSLTTTLDDVLGDVPLVNTLALGGDDAIDAGVAFSQVTFPEGASTAILSREDLFADAFSSGGFQGSFGAPLLFTDSDDLDRRTGTELQRLGMDTVALLGGEDALHPIVVNKLQSAGLDIIRIGGATRVETAIEAAQAITPDATHAVLVRAYPDAGQPDSQAYADLLAAGPFAAENNWPILMTTSDSLHPAVAEQLEDFDAVTIIGGTGAVSQAVQDSLTSQGLTVDRIAGDNRFATAVAIAAARGFTSASSADRLVIAEQGGRDDVWAPGFASTAQADLNRAPVLLTDGALIPSETMAFLTDGLADNLVDGGPAVICASFVDPVACQAIGALMTLNLGLVQQLIGTLEGIPLLGDLLVQLGLAGLLDDALNTLISLLEGAGISTDQIAQILGALATADPAQVQALLDSLAGDLDLSPDDLAGALEGTLPLDDVLGDLGGTEDPLGGVGGVVDDTLGGGILGG
ncbi:MAG: cell wall-binding repeat-containing protein [Euzebya sp.]